MIDGFVQINSNFIRKDEIKTLVIEKNEVCDDGIDWVAGDLFIIINGTDEYCIQDDDIDSWFTFIKTWYNIEDFDEVTHMSAKLCKMAKSRGQKD